MSVVFVANALIIQTIELDMKEYIQVKNHFNVIPVAKGLHLKLHLRFMKGFTLETNHFNVKGAKNVLETHPN